MSSSQEGNLRAFSFSFVFYSWLLLSQYILFHCLLLLAVSCPGISVTGLPTGSDNETNDISNGIRLSEPSREGSRATLDRSRGRTEAASRQRLPKPQKEGAMEGACL